MLYHAADNTIVVLASLAVGAIVVIVIVITIGIVVCKKKNRFVHNNFNVVFFVFCFDYAMYFPFIKYQT